MTGNTINVYYVKRKLAINMQIFAFYEVSGGPYCNRDGNSGSETYVANFYMVTCDNYKQSRIQCLIYFAANDKQLWILYRTTVTNTN